MEDKYFFYKAEYSVRVTEMYQILKLEFSAKTSLLHCSNHLCTLKCMSREGTFWLLKCRRSESTAPDRAVCGV